MLWKTKSLKSRYTVKKRHKYVGDPTKVVARSSWERSTFIWCENNPRVVKWSSEYVKIKYINPLDKKTHTYIVDLLIWWDDGSIEMVEIKPKYQVKKPKTPRRKTKKFIREAAEYVRNRSKWDAAEKYAKARGWKFSKWHEDVLKAKGIKII